jgi:signal transduction histidine kinase
MEIKNKLTLQFVILVSLILATSLFTIYVFSVEYRTDDFYSRLKNKALNTAKLLIEIDEIDAGILRKLERDNPTALPYEKILIYNKNDKLIFSTDEQHILNIKQDVLNIIKSQGETRFKQGNYEIIGLLFPDNNNNFIVITGAIDIYGNKRLIDLSVILIFVFLFTIIVLLVMGRVFALRALNPMNQVVKQVSGITASNLNMRVNEGNGRDEISRLAKTFNDMLERIEQSFETQKKFIDNASHELRTPLTAISSQLEVTLMNERSQGDYKICLMSVQEDIRNMINLTNQLLMIARADTVGATVQQVEMRLDEVLWQARADVIKAHPNYKINITFSKKIDDEKYLTIKGYDSLFRNAIINLIDNGCKYSSDHKVSVDVEPLNQYIKISFVDDGIGIAKEDLDRITQPFYRGANATKITGHGIGLSLVDKIFKMHKCIMRINSILNKGTTIEVLIPVSS